MALLTVAGVVLGLPTPVWAVYAKSSGYSVDETLLGGSGLTTQSSTSYSARSEVGDIVVGDTASTNFQARTGNVNDAEPALTFAVNTPSATFTPGFTRTAVSHAAVSFSIKNYTSYGYTVSLYGTLPTKVGGSYTIPAMATNAASVPGTEQFGANLVANTGFGANPVQVPSGSFSYGLASANYNSADSYRFVAGDQVAQASKSSGQTDFTISYIINVKGTTPSGTYTTNQELICVGFY